MTPERAAPTGRTPDGTAYRVVGQGEPLVLLHGVGMQSGIWSPQIAELSKSHQVIVYDMLGHGASRAPRSTEHLGCYAAQLAELMDYLGVPEANVAGHSMGALVALEFALTRSSRTLRVAALNAVYRRTAQQRSAVVERAATLGRIGIAATIDSTLVRWFDDPVPHALAGAARQVRSYLEQVHPEGYAHAYGIFAQSDEAHAGRLHQLNMPSLFLTGEEDANSSPAMSLAMGGDAPYAEVEVIPGARHMMNVTTPDAVTESLQRWLARPLDV